MEDTVVEAQNLDEMFPVPISKGHRLPNVVYQVRIVTVLIDCPKVDAGGRRKWRFKHRAFIACEGKWPDEVEGDVRRRFHGGVTLQYKEESFAKPPNLLLDA